MLDRLFQLKKAGTTVRTELVAGLTIFLTMSYIIFLQPAVLSGSLMGMDTGMDPGSVLTATCIANLKEVKGKYGIVSMCVGGGMGAAAIFELI